MSRLFWKRVIIAGTIAGVVVLGFLLATKETWGPEVPGDRRYRSGRASTCRPPDLPGEDLPGQMEDLGLRPLERGFQHSWVYTFDAAKLTGGNVYVCSEYGSVKLVGVASNQVRARLSVENAFPGGADAVNDTKVAVQVRRQGGQLQVGAWQLTQGGRAFRTVLKKGSRPTNVNVVLELPRNVAYDLRLTANHHRITVQGLDVRGVMEGYVSPGADIDAGLAGDLTLRIDGGNNFGLQGGTTAKLRPLRSASLNVEATQGDVQIKIVGPVGLDVTANGAGGQGNINIGPTEASLEGPSATYARSAGFGRASVQLKIRANSPGGTVAVGRVAQ